MFIGLLTFVFFRYVGIDHTIKGYDEVLNSIITFSSIIIGFYTAMYGVLLTLKEADIFKKFRELKIDKTFKIQLYESLVVSFLILIASIALQVLVNYEQLQLTQLFFYAWSFLLGYFVSGSFKTIQLLLKIMFNHEEKTKQSTVDDIPPTAREAMKERLRKNKKDS